ncbi:hypothetical protein [Nocardia cyriacigeorgica]|jgi:hypothetical protein|nr:hypothetical protein [Nocardia cyriacigeorgica]MBF6086991.1 hypothetical protein [Nocardia cyriacigeorgica]MBF6093072.1 hypothetical protein [Nocardia cyriacigeorgica]MBF6102341.1 hypothetical protein [Nocardia cyriacigeorgica]MBF6161265.1 hypothetical protein [Nocardia cyriacigeorgica]MBF6200064.1 hypothetical protein [Nocardia cyriacigeorgica]
MTDDRMADIYAAVRLGGVDQQAARSALHRLWEEIGEHGDPLHRCVIAHHLADVVDTAEEALLWDQRALAAVFAPGSPLDEGMRGFLPSLYLNLADSHRRVGDFDSARMQLALAKGHLEVLANDAYGQVIRTGLDHVAGALDAGSTERLKAS